MKFLSDKARTGLRDGRGHAVPAGDALRLLERVARGGMGVS